MEHKPVLAAEVVSFFEPLAREGVLIDATIGGGGHSLAVLKAWLKQQESLPSSLFQGKKKAETGGFNRYRQSAIGGNRFPFQLLGIDRDGGALKAAERSLGFFLRRAGLKPEDVFFLTLGNFRNIGNIVRALSKKDFFKRSRSLNKIFGVIADLGVSSLQLESRERGFSFRYDAPLDMRMDSNGFLAKKCSNRNFFRYPNEEPQEFKLSGGLTAELIVKTWNEKKLADIFWRYGEERFARKIAKAVVSNRRAVNTTKDLAELVKRCIPPRYRKRGLHPATKTFQALRIAVNDEMSALEDFLRSAPDLLRKGGRLAIISFHSLEDRAVKQRFNELEAGKGFKKVTKKAVTPTLEEVAVNPRSRSAKLRVIERVC